MVRMSSPCRGAVTHEKVPPSKLWLLSCGSRWREAVIPARAGCPLLDAALRCPSNSGRPQAGSPRLNRLACVSPVTSELRVGWVRVGSSDTSFRPGFHTTGQRVLCVWVCGSKQPSDGPSANNLVPQSSDDPGSSPGYRAFKCVFPFG